jgi:NAD(P)-dependent dehydrogenase (short-subunit alcohol dehydrogenase family)
MSGIALITGTSSGIGLSSAIHLAKAGFQVVATLRDTGKAGPLQARAREEGVTLDIMPLDVQSDTSVQACIPAVLAKYGKIDVLVNNAGAGHLGSLEQTSQEELRQTMEVNFFGVWRTTQAVFPSMRQARSGRILTVTSVGGLIGQPFNDAYCAAKFACEGFLESLAPVAKRLGIHLVAIEPGAVTTEFVATVQGRKPGGPVVSEEYRPMLEAYIGAAKGAYAQLAQSSDDVAKVIVEAATAETPHFRYATSEVIRKLAGQKYKDITGDSILEMTGSRLS